MILCSWEPNCKDKYVFSQGRGPSFSSSSSPSHTLSMEQLSAEHLALWWSGDLVISGDLWWSGDLVISGDLLWSGHLVISGDPSLRKLAEPKLGRRRKDWTNLPPGNSSFPNSSRLLVMRNWRGKTPSPTTPPPPSLKGGARPWTSTVTKDPNLDWIALVAVTTILIQIPL